MLVLRNKKFPVGKKKLSKILINQAIRGKKPVTLAVRFDIVILERAYITLRHQNSFHCYFFRPIRSSLVQDLTNLPANFHILANQLNLLAHLQN